MMRGLDTNVLVYAHIPAFSEHRPVRKFLLDQLGIPEIILAVTPGVLHEFVHVITDSRRFDNPVSMSEALSIARLYLGRKNVSCLGADEAVMLRAVDLLEQHGLGRKRIADTLFAATLLHHGVREIITCNPGDYRIFSDLHVIDPRAEQPA